MINLDGFSAKKPAAFGRLCVETAVSAHIFGVMPQPPSGGCVLKPDKRSGWREAVSSRLRAAVC